MMMSWIVFLTKSLVIYYCVESVIPHKQIIFFPSNKPWMTREVKAAINRKKAAFFSGDRDRIKNVQKELKRVIKQSKFIRKDLKNNFGMV